MRKVKVKMKFEEVIVLRDMLMRFEEHNALVIAASSTLSDTKKKMIKMYQSTLSIVLYKLKQKTILVWPKARTFSFTLPEAFAISVVLKDDFSGDFELALFSSLQLQIEPQLP